MLTIGFEGMRFHSAVGVFAEEKIIGNEIEIDLTVEIPDIIVNDSLEATVDYSEIHEEVAEVMKEQMDLLETVADNIISALAGRFPSIEKIWIRVAKIHPPLPARISKVFIEKKWSKK